MDTQAKSLLTKAIIKKNHSAKQEKRIKPDKLSSKQKTSFKLWFLQFQRKRKRQLVPVYKSNKLLIKSLIN